MSVHAILQAMTQIKSSTHILQIQIHTTNKHQPLQSTTAIKANERQKRKEIEETQTNLFTIFNDVLILAY